MITDLGNGLIIRRSSPKDAEQMAEFKGSMHANREENFSEHIAQWVDDLLIKPHPTFNTNDFTVVENKETGEIVSSICLINQIWSYDGIEFGVGQPELVSTHPDYRGRGLIHYQFEIIHKWSAERRQMAQVIHGIPWYFRKFGYETSLELGGGRSSNDVIASESKNNKYHICPADENDILFINRLYHKNISRYSVSCVYDEALWQYEINGRNHESIAHRSIAIIESSLGEDLGFFIYTNRVSNNEIVVLHFEVKNGTSWHETALSVFQYLTKIGSKLAQPTGLFKAIRFELGSSHPIYSEVGKLLPIVNKPLAWYVRVPDLISFLQHISPALENRLANSRMNSYSGELKLNFYIAGIRMGFEKGKIITVEPWENPSYKSASAQFPNKTFLQLLFGYRSLEDLDNAFFEAYASWRHPDATSLLQALFPPKASAIFSVK